MAKTRSVPPSVGAAGSSSATAGATQGSEPTLQAGPSAAQSAPLQETPAPLVTSAFPDVPVGFWERLISAVTARDNQAVPQGFNADPSVAPGAADPDPGDDSSLSSSSDEDDDSEPDSSGAGLGADLPDDEPGQAAGRNVAPARRLKLRKSMDLKVDFPEKYKAAYTFQQRDNWKAEMERVFEAAPFAYQRQRQRVLAALSRMDSSFPPLWDQYLADLPEAEAKSAKKSWVAFVIWLNTLGPESGDLFLTVLEEYLSTKQSPTQAPSKLLAELRSLEDKLESLPERFKTGVFQLALLPSIRSQLAVGGINSESTRRAMVQRAEEIWKNTGKQKGKAPQTASKRSATQDDISPRPNKRNKRGRTNITSKDSPLNQRGFPRPKSKGSNASAAVICYHCGEPGHYASSCKDKADGKPPTVSVHLTRVEGLAPLDKGKVKDKGKGKEKAT